MDSTSVHLNTSEVSAVLNPALKVEHSVIYSDREQLGIPVSVDLIVIRRHLLIEGLGYLLEVVIVSYAVDHLIRRHKCEIVRHNAESRMCHQIYIVAVAVICALSEFSIKLPYLLLIYPGSVEDRSCNKLELLRPACAVICPEPQPSLVIALKHENVLPIPDGYQEIDYLRVLHASVYIITCEYIELIVLYTAVVIQILHQSRITSVDISDVMDPLVLGEIPHLHPNAVELIRLYDRDPRRDPLCSEPGVHLVNNIIRYYLELLPPGISSLHFFYRYICKIDTVHSVSVCLTHILVSVHLRSLGICGVDHREFTLLHTYLKKTEQCLPYRTIVALADTSRAIHLQHRTLTQKSDVVR